MEYWSNEKKPEQMTIKVQKTAQGKSFALAWEQHKQKPKTNAQAVCKTGRYNV